MNKAPGMQKENYQDWSQSSDNYNRIIHDELNSFRPEKWQHQILSQVLEKGPLKILDAGCGPAFFTIILAGKGHQVTGIDGSEGMLEKARKNVEQLGISADILKMDCHHLDFSDDTFDLIVSRNVTHALWDHVQVYKEWKRVLKPGGVLLIFDANWHLTQASGTLRETYLKDVKECIRRFGSDFNENTDPEAISYQEYEMAEKPHRLGDLQRPDWDIGILQALGYQEISYDRDITDELWDDKEKLIYRTTPMFMIRGVK